jgi:hypothetical protein
MANADLLVVDRDCVRVNPPAPRLFPAAPPSQRHDLSTECARDQERSRDTRVLGPHPSIGRREPANGDEQMTDRNVFQHALSHWLIEPRQGAGTAPRRLIVAAESAANAREYAEHWRRSRRDDGVGPFTDQRVYLVRRLPDQAVGAPAVDRGVVIAEPQPA